MPQFYFIKNRIMPLKQKTKKERQETKAIRSFPRNYWIVIIMEFFERGSYYGVLSILSVYLVSPAGDGGLGLTRENVGLISSITKPLLYLLPILSGAIADRYG